ncbi:cation channel family protein (macronuclear) [Tetrahymena thermophila SB210]|uniref:Cation channel family protein n=1 Tax=Tetrahymena thermophila (strain SB210) TaxID=312017 RepID=I7M4K1_TETTS|nr:cation channel family protein [Tetrahymena thermophila SB210]EAS07212.2 cation channel family protein [Tetrahymena thermophila SB210]|eukprot:XP_001027454.2 cation channel family protein [Tetrahymena thermophila SB210]
MTAKQTVLLNRFYDLKQKNENHSYLKSTNFLWNVSIFIIDLYVVSIYQIWLALDLNPCNMYIILGISLEFIYLVNLILVIAIKNKQSNMRYYFFTHLKFNSIYSSTVSLMNLISLIPTHLIIVVYLKKQGNTDIYQDVNFPKALNLALLTKLIRFLNIKEFLDKFEHLVKFLDFNKLTFFRIFVSLFQLLQITHLFACCFVFYNIYIQSGYFSVTPYDISGNYMKYVVGLQWAVESMIGSSFGDVYPPTDGEIFLTFISMVAGGVFYCKIFSDFSSLLQISEQFTLELRQKQKQAYLLANNKQVSQKTFDKIQYFYNNFEEGQKILMYYSIIQELPSQLKHEVVLKFQQNLVQNVQIFNLGQAEFVAKMLKKMYPQVAVKDDFVLKMGESAQDFYILAKGRVEIVNQDKKQVIRVLEPGAYFGEVAILINQYRTCYVKAQTDCIFMCIKKDDFLKILNKFPEIKDFLLRVGQQRMGGTKNNEDIFHNIDKCQINKLSLQPLEIKNTQNSNHSLIKRGHIQDTIQNNYFAKVDQLNSKSPQNDTQKCQSQFLSNEEANFIGESINISFENENLKRKIQRVREQKDLKVLVLNQKVMIYWAMILLIVLTYNLFYSLYSILFSEDFAGDVSIVLEALSFLINFIDSLIFSRLSTFSRKDNEFILSSNKILFNYLNKEFFFDMLATVPFSNIYQLVCSEQEFQNSLIFIRLFRLLRLIKFRRFQQYIYILQDQYKINFKYAALIKLAYVYFFLNHLNAGIMYILCKYEYDNNLSYSLGVQMDGQSIEQERPFMIKNFYVNFLYWSFCVSTQGAYGDIWAMSSLEKTYQNVTNIFFKIFFCFLFANLASVTTVSKNKLEQYLEEVDSFKYWSKLIGLSSEIQNRIIKVYNYRWYHQKGIEDKELEETLLPDNIKDKILHQRMKFIVKLINPLQNSQLDSILMLFLKRFEKIIITQGEFVFQKGDLAQEIYFIEEGVVQIVNNNNNNEEVLAEISQYGYFGGLEFINIVPSLRKISIKAKTNTSLFMLELDQYYQLLEEYPFAKMFIQNIYPQEQSENNKQKIFEDRIQHIKQNKNKNLIDLVDFENYQVDNEANLNNQEFQQIHQKLNIDENYKMRIQLINQEKQITFNQQILYNNNNHSNQILLYNDLIGSVCQTKVCSEQNYFYNQPNTHNLQDLQITHKLQQHPQQIELMRFDKQEPNQIKEAIFSIQQDQQINLNAQLNQKQDSKVTLQQKDEVLNNINKNLLKQQEPKQIAIKNFQKPEQIDVQQLNQSQRRLSLIYFDDSSDFSNYQKLENVKNNQLKLNTHSNLSQAQIRTESNSSLSQDSQKNFPKNYRQKEQKKRLSQLKQHKNNYLKKKKQTFSLEDLQQIHSKENNLGLYNSSFGDYSQNLSLLISKNSLTNLNLDQFGIIHNIKKFDSDEFNQNQNDHSFLDLEMEYNQEFEKIQSYFDKNLEFQVLVNQICDQTKQYNNQLTDQEFNEFEEIIEIIGITQNEIQEESQLNNKINLSGMYEQDIRNLQQNQDQSQIISNINSNYLDYSTFNDSYYQINELDKSISYSQLSFDLEEPIKDDDCKEELSKQIKQSQLLNQKNQKISKLRERFIQFLLNVYITFSKTESLISLTQLYFTIIIPLYLAFKEISFQNSILITVEILIIVNEFRYLIKLIKLYKEIIANISEIKYGSSQLQLVAANSFSQKIYSLKIFQKRKEKVFIMMLLEILMIIPFCLIFDLLQIEGIRTRFELIFLQLIRVIPFCRIFNVLSTLKKKNIYLCRVIETLLVYVLFCHLLGCLFIVLGKIEQDFNASWLIKVPAPQAQFPNNIRIQLSISNRSLYLHAIYWAYVTTSHVGVGDVTGVNLREKIFSIFVMYISTFTHIIIFGNLASMAKEAAFMLKIKLDQKYEKIFQTVSLLNVTSFKIQVESYINFIWNDSYGLDENQILEKLPFYLKVEILKKRYKKCINETFVFKSNSWQVDMNIVHSILRFMKVKIFLTNDVIAEAGKSYQDLYIFLQGKYVTFQLNGKKAYEAQVGGFFGGSQTDLPLTLYYQAKNICKVGVIDKQYVKYLKQVFPDWYEKIIGKQKKMYQSYLLDLSYFQDDFVFSQQQTQYRFIVNKNNHLIDYHYSEKLLDHYKQVASNFFEVEVANNSQDNNNNLKSIQILNQINTTDEDDFENENTEQMKNQEEFASNIKYSQKEIEGIKQWKKRIAERNKSMVWDFQNVSVHKNQSQIENNILKSEYFHKPFAICLPYQTIADQSLQNNKDMIILHFNYIYKLAFIKDNQYNYFLHPYSSASYYVQLINLIFTIYSLIFTPIYVFFGLQISILPLVFEIIHTMYLFVELFIDLRTPYFKQGLLVTNSRKIFAYLWEKKNLKLRLICLLPLNIILWQISQDYQERSFTLKLVFVLLRGIRLLQIFNLDAILVRIQTHNKSKQKAIGMLVGFLHVLTMWHYFSSLWIWYVYNISVPNFPESNWVVVNNLQDADLIKKILNGLFFVMSIATTCGYPTMKSNNDIEKIFFIFAIYFGDAIIAYDFGLIAAQSLLLPQKYQEIDKKVKQFKILLNIGKDHSKNSSIIKLHKKIELSYLYKLYSNLYVEQQLKQIQNLIPETLYDQLFQSHQANYLQKIPILLELSKFIHFRNIQKHIELKVFLPYDFITKKDSQNGYLCFVSKGNVNILSPKEDAVIQVLKEGDFFSQVTLTKYGKSSSCHIITSNIAEIVQIKHKNVRLMFKIFPEFQNAIYKYARKQICVPVTQNEIKLNLLSDYQEEAFSQVNQYFSGNLHTGKRYLNMNSNIFFTQENDLDEQQMLKNCMSSQNNQKQQLQSDFQIKSKNEYLNNIPSQIHLKQLQERNQVQISQCNFSQQSYSSEASGGHTKKIGNIRRNFLLEDDEGFLANNLNHSKDQIILNKHTHHLNLDVFQNNQQQNPKIQHKKLPKKYSHSNFNHNSFHLNLLKECNLNDEQQQQIGIQSQGQKIIEAQKNQNPQKALFQAEENTQKRQNVIELIQFNDLSLKENTIEAQDQNISIKNLGI